MPFPTRSTARTLARGAWPLAALLASLAVAACVQNPGARGGPFPQFGEFEGERVGRVTWAGNPILPLDSLNAVTLVRPPRCRVRFLPRKLCITGLDWYRLDLAELAGDIVRMQLYYRDHGYYGTRIVPSVERTNPEEVAVRFAIAPGDRVILRQLAVEGTEEVLPEEQILPRLPLSQGEPFRRAAFLATADSIRSLLQRRGFAYTEVLRNYSIDTIADVAEASYVVVPGPVVRVDSIRVLGADRLDRRTVLKQVAVREGEILRVPELATSQRNLYQLSIVNFASVELAPDSLQQDPDSTTATVVVRVVEAPKYLLDTAAGYGSIDCLRTGARLLDRNFLGGGRTLELSASAAKIGVGAPLDLGLDGSLCRGLRNDPFSDQLTYRVASEFVQPRLLGTRTRLSAGVHAERQAELNLFLRQSVGGQTVLSRGIGRGALLGAGLEVDYGRTEATDAIFCVLFAACTEDERQPLEGNRWSNAATLSASLDRTELLTVAARGYQLRLGTAFASRALGSDDRYLSVLGEAVRYYPVRQGWVLAGRLQAGQFLTGRLGLDESFIPLERRFYGGGPNSVRGFPANALGPQAYVTDSLEFNNSGELEEDLIQSFPLGGTRTVIGQLELRFPSPVLSDFFRLAAFVDAGQVWSRRADDEILGVTRSSGPVLVTPGLGVRVTTPVGPIRVDVGYNPYERAVGPLYQALTDERGETTGELILIDPEYRPTQSFLDRFQFHIAVGQAF
jgi:outer membrane protein assembly factor BamA